ncbi:hypothetical protein DFJ77DRAFT_370352 [Powellomyces hirtus]|nr:hypothetical protein DFJ77DRAFT_370352 [Powellomyces hirtus]
MDLVNSLHSSAAALYAQGKFRDSYNTYIRAANAALVRLVSGTTWTREDITSKPDGFTELLRLSHQCITRAEEIVKARSILTTSTPRSAPAASTLQPGSERASTPFVPPFPEEVPSIPISPVTQQQWKHAHELRKAEARYEAAQNGPTTPDLGKLRRLLEDVRIERSKVQELQELTELVAAVPLSKWRPEDLARQIAIVDASLFAKVNVRQDLGRRASQIGESVKACLDFHLYLERIFIHAILDGALGTSEEDSGAARAFILALLVSVAHLIFYQYRDVNGLCAILRAFSSPEVRRLQKTWDTLPAKSRETLRDLEAAVGNNTGRDHLELIAQILQYHYAGGGVLVAIPYLEPFILDIEDLHNAYSAGMKGDNGEVMLSAIGTRSLEEVLSTIALCQGVGRPDPGLGKAGKAAASHHISHESSEKVPDDLCSLGVGNRGLGHWLVTRVYWSRMELWGRSTECEELRRGETLPAEYAELAEKYAAAVLQSTIDAQKAEKAAEDSAALRAAELFVSDILGSSNLPQDVAIDAGNTAKSHQSDDDDDGGDNSILAMLADLPAIPQVIAGGDDDHLPTTFADLHIFPPRDEAVSSDLKEHDVRMRSPCDESEEIVDHTAQNVQTGFTPAEERVQPSDEVMSESQTAEKPIPEAGYDYMDNYLGSLNEPFPGSNMESNVTEPLEHETKASEHVKSDTLDDSDSPAQNDLPRPDVAPIIEESEEIPHSGVPLDSDVVQTVPESDGGETPVPPNDTNTADDGGPSVQDEISRSGVSLPSNVAGTVTELDDGETSAAPNDSNTADDELRRRLSSLR